MSARSVGLSKIIEDAKTEVLQGDGVFDLEKMVPLVASRLPTDEAAIAPLIEARARQLIRNYDQRQRPQRMHGELFPDIAWVPLGKSERITLGGAKLVHLQLWAAIEADNHASQSVAYAQKSARIAEWLRTWAAPENRDCENLGALWQRAFGWVPSPIPVLQEDDGSTGEEFPI